ncbi:MAG TPA: hypothetical protein VFI65_16990 [Streptosporangiaceae bacterium]|nr:hypothetical protein [Streptosporangiaceae bacterium]
MPIDEDILHDLMHRATEDLHASPAVAAAIAGDHRRRHLRTRAIGFSVTGVAAATAVGVAAATAGTAGKSTAHNTAGPHTTRPTIVLTASQRVLNRLSFTAARGRAKSGSGRYVEMSELEGADKRTTIMDSKTGDVWTFQSGKGIPSTFPVSRHGSPTGAELAAYPTSLPALRSLLVKQAKRDIAIGWRLQVKAAKIKDPKDWRRVLQTIKKDSPRETRDDLVFSQAAYLLWNPLVDSALRSALFKVLAATPGVIVSAHAHDSIGRPAVEISRFDRAANYTEAIFESPDASRVLETVSIHPPTKPANGLPGEAGYSLNDTYVKVTWHNTRPTKDPYKG